MKQSSREVYLFLLPFSAVFAVFLFFPAIYSIYLSFRHATIYTDLTRIFSSMTFVGLDNYRKLLTDREFLWSLIMTMYYAVLVIPSGIFLSLGLAAALSNKLPGHKLFRSAFFLPNILDLFVIAIVWMAIYMPDTGALDQILKFVKLEKFFDHGILADPWFAMPAVALVVVLKGSGFGMILYLAAIQNIPADIYEAADIDGASAWQQFTRITVPLVKPVTLILVVTGILGSLMAFSEIYALTNGGPVKTFTADTTIFGGTTQMTTKISGFYLFEKFYLAQDYGYAAALSVILLFISLPLSFVSFFVMRPEGPTMGEMWAKFRKRSRPASEAAA